MKQTFNLGEIFLTSWKFTKSQLAILCGLLIGFIIILFTLSILVWPAQSSIGGIIVSNTILSVITYLFTMGYLKNMFQTLDDIEPQFSAYGQQAFKLLKFFIANLVLSLISLIGFCLLILPGLYLSGRLQYAIALIIEENTGIVESFKRSWAITKAHEWKLVALILIQLLICIVGFLLLGIGIFIATPLIMMMYCYSFRILNSPLQLVDEA